MNFKPFLASAGMLAATVPAAAQAQGYGYGAPPPPPYAYAYAAPAAAASCGEGFTLLGAHAGVTVLGFGLNAGAKFTTPADCSGGYGYGYAPQFAPRPYAPPPPAPAAYPPPAYGAQGWGAQGYDDDGRGGYPPPCGCDAPRW